MGWKAGVVSLYYAAGLVNGALVGRRGHAPYGHPEPAVPAHAERAAGRHGRPSRALLQVAEHAIHVVGRKSRLRGEESLLRAAHWQEEQEACNLTLPPKSRALWSLQCAIMAQDALW